MLDLILLFVHIVTTLVRLAGPGGVRSVVAECLSDETSIARSQSFSTPSAAPWRIGSTYRRMVWAPCLASTTHSLRNCRETIDGTRFPSRFGSPKIPAAVFAKEPIKARTQRARSGSDQGSY